MRNKDRNNMEWRMREKGKIKSGGRREREKGGDRVRRHRSNG